MRSSDCRCCRETLYLPASVKTLQERWSGRTNLYRSFPYGWLCELQYELLTTEPKSNAVSVLDMATGVLNEVGVDEGAVHGAGVV